MQGAPWPSARCPPVPHRVDFIAKQLGGLREHEKRIRGLESQVGGPAPMSKQWAPEGLTHILAQPQSLETKCLPLRGSCTPREILH